MSTTYVRYPIPAAGSISPTAFPLLAPNGTAGAPSYSFSSSPTTGVYSSSSNTLDFSTNSTQAFSINSSQNATLFGNLVVNKQVSLGGGSAVQSAAMVTLGNITQTSLVGTTQEAALISGRANSAATARAIGATSEFRTDASAFTCGAGLGIRILTPTIGAGSTVTRNIGLGFQGVGTGGTNNAFISDNETFTGNFFLHSTSTSPSQLNGSLVVGTAAIATNATDGFLYLPSCAGVPSGTPTTRTGTVATVYDTTDNKLYVFNGSWKSVTLA